jgi:uncharacterized protein (TIGR02147 family)
MDPNRAIFSYSDYHAFLREYYNWEKKKQPHFSYALWAQMCGFSSGSFLHLVIDGKRDLSPNSASRIILSMKLRGKAATCFRSLVAYSQAKSLAEKQKYLHIIDRYRNVDAPRKLRNDEYQYLDKWYNPLIREMISLPGFEETAKWIRGASLFPLRRRDVERALHFLLASGFLFRDRNGRLIKLDKTLRAAADGNQEAMALAIRRYHIAMLQLAEKAVAMMPVEDRTVTDTTISLSKAGYESAVQRIRQMRSELLAIAAADNAADRIYQVNCVFFPLTKSLVQVKRNKTISDNSGEGH